METEVILGLGSNLGNREENIRNAIRLINERCGVIDAIASLYESEPVGFNSESNFLNTCIQIRTLLEPNALLNELIQIEKELGRTSKSTSGSYSSRTIDIDIIFFDDRVLSENDLVVPHPRYQDRKFVLLPLNDLDRNRIDPRTGISVYDTLQHCLDESSVSVYKKDFSLNE